MLLPLRVAMGAGLPEDKFDGARRRLSCLTNGLSRTGIAEDSSSTSPCAAPEATPSMSTRDGAFLGRHGEAPNRSVIDERTTSGSSSVSKRESSASSMRDIVIARLGGAFRPTAGVGRRLGRSFSFWAGGVVAAAGRVRCPSLTQNRPFAAGRPEIGQPVRDSVLHPRPPAGALTQVSGTQPPWEAAHARTAKWPARRDRAS